MKTGDLVRSEETNCEGLVIKCFENWEDLKLKSRFVTIDPNEDMDTIEKLINGDPKDKWLEMQEHPFTEEQLKERWFTVATYDGGEIWSCESRLGIINNV